MDVGEAGSVQTRILSASVQIITGRWLVWHVLYGMARLGLVTDGPDSLKSQDSRKKCENAEKVEKKRRMNELSQLNGREDASRQRPTAATEIRMNDQGGSSVLRVRKR